jgi:hypothetical protein
VQLAEYYTSLGMTRRAKMIAQQQTSKEVVVKFMI